MFRCNIYNILDSIRPKRNGGYHASISNKKAKQRQLQRDAITIRPLKATGTAIRDAAAAAGQSLQGYILQAVRARMEQEGQPLKIEQTPAESGEEGGL